ncbi:hypothetical protein [Microbulbifer sp. PSTR4-B]|uniref:hypothetical protein n=1 Tax=Microbulbifer sp. PSTR4-B TaxID=3243396 RepID=UPI00403A2F72
MLKMIKINCLLISLFFGFSVAVNAYQSAYCADPILEVDFDGVVIAGSKQRLVNVALSGEPMRVGWDLDFDGDKQSDLTHWSDAQFTSVVSGEVATKVQSVHRQIPRLEDEKIELSTDFGQWHGLLDSRGILLGRFEHSKRINEDRVHSIWCFTEPPRKTWKMVFQHDRAGSTIEGEKSQLVDAVEGGWAIRLGRLDLTKEKLEKEIAANKVAELVPISVQISPEGEVIAQLPQSFLPKHFLDSSINQYANSKVLWGAKVSTAGELDLIWEDLHSGQISRQRRSQMGLAWFVERPVK